MKTFSDWIDLPFYLFWILALRAGGSFRWFRIRQTFGAMACVVQYEITFRIPFGSEGHANVYVIQLIDGGTLVVTGQNSDKLEGVRARQYDYYLSLFLNSAWLFWNRHVRSAFGQIYHFTTDIDSGEVFPIRRYDRNGGWQPYPQKFKYLSEIEAQFLVKLPNYSEVHSVCRSAASVNGNPEIGLNFLLCQRRFLRQK
jgi:hypothetical protein